jgi:O-antigen ligase
MARVDREWPWLGGMIVQNWQPNAPADSPQWGYAILGPDGQPTALYNTLASLPRESARNGIFHPMTPYARYSGLWTFSEQGADIGWLETSDSQLDFDFTGRDIALWTRQDDYVAFLYPTIDGQSANANALPQDNAGNAYVFLRSASLEPEFNLVPLAHSLPDAAHTLHVIADRGWDRWALAGYAVSEGSLAQPYQTQIALASLTAAICALAVLYTGWQVQWAAYRPLALVGRRLSTGQHLALSFVTSLALMIGLLLTWGDSVPTLFRRDTLNLGALIILSGGLVAMQPGLILTLITLVILFWLIYQRIEHGLMLALIFAPYFAFPVELYKFSFPMVELITLLTAAAWLLHALADWGRERQRDPSFSLRARIISRWHALDTWVLAWLILGVVAFLWSERRDRAVTELRTFFIEPALFYAIFRTTIRDAKMLRRCVDMLILSGLVMAIIGLFTYGRCVLTDVCTMVIEAEGGARRLASVYGSPNNVALFLGRCVPFVVAFLLMPVGVLDQNEKSALWARYQKIYYVFTLLIMLITILLTQSVGALILGLPVGIGIVLIASYGRRAVWPLVGVAGVGTAVVAILTQVSDRFASLFTADRGTNFIRLRLWESTIDILRDHPLTGLGLDQFLYVYRDSYIRPDAVYDRDLSHPHNVLLDFWVRLGIGGVLLLIVGQFLFWRACLHLLAIWQQRDAMTHGLIIGAMGAMAALLAHGLIDNSVYVLDLVYVFMLLWAIPSVLETVKEEI